MRKACQSDDVGLDIIDSVDQAAAQLEQGNSLATAGDLAGAIGAYRHAIAVRPDWTVPYLALGKAQVRLAEYRGALESLATTRALGEDGAEVWRWIGLTFAKLQRWTAATAALRAAVARDPGMSSAWHALGHVLRFSGQLDDARDAFFRAVDLGERGAIPESIETLLDLGDLDGAAARLTALGADCDDAARGWLAARTAFLAGDLVAGWWPYEARLRAAPGLKQEGVELVAVRAPRWRGEDLAGRRIAVIAEQGYGDVIQFARFAKLLAARAADVHFVLPRKMRTLAPLLARVDGVHVVEVEPDISAVDFHVPLLSLPYHFGTRLETIPTERYLELPVDDAAGPGIVPSWHALLTASSASSTINVGLVWAGDPDHPNDPRRSASIEAMLPLASDPRVRLFSLQCGPRSNDLRGYEPLVTNLSSHLTDWRDTASVVRFLDLVVTVDTAVAHLAGALGRPTWVALAYSPDWRWMLKRDDSPWYPTMRLFRQPAPGDWEGVFAQMSSRLEMSLGRGVPPDGGRQDP
jgi:tetratricopeptide (TPR) repeat protein